MWFIVSDGNWFNEPLCQPHQPCSVSTSDGGLVGDWHLLHGMVLCVSFKNKCCWCFGYVCEQVWVEFNPWLNVISRRLQVLDSGSARFFRCFRTSFMNLCVIFICIFLFVLIVFACFNLASLYIAWKFTPTYWRLCGWSYSHWFLIWVAANVYGPTSWVYPHQYFLLFTEAF